MILGFAIPLTPKTKKIIMQNKTAYPYHFAQFTHFPLTRILYKQPLKTKFSPPLHPHFKKTLQWFQKMIAMIHPSHCNDFRTRLQWFPQTIAIIFLTFVFRAFLRWFSGLKSSGNTVFQGKISHFEVFSQLSNSVYKQLYISALKPKTQVLIPWEYQANPPKIFYTDLWEFGRG